MRTFFGPLTGNVEDGKIKKANVTFLEHDILSTPPAESNKFAAPAPKGIKEGRKKGLELVTLKIGKDKR
jgi:hypothetical protein